MLEILFISDYVCPYCLVAKEALKQAIQENGTEATITWQPYELTMEPKPRVDTYNDASRKRKYKVLVEPCKQLGLDMKLPPNVVPRPYTRLAFEGWYFACDQGKGDAYNDLMYKAYFVDEMDIGDIEVLTKLAESLGLDGAAFKQALETGTYSEKEKAAVAYAKSELKPKGVPTIYINGVKVSVSEYTKEEMIRILSEQMPKNETLGFSCSSDGCK